MSVLEENSVCKQGQEQTTSDPPNHQANHQANHQQCSPCHFQGCVEKGEYRAPVSKTHDGEIQYHHFCKIHAREKNLLWNYFADMTDDEADAFREASYSWHRTTNGQESMASNSAEYLDELSEISEEIDTLLGQRSSSARKAKPNDNPYQQYSAPVELAMRQMAMKTMPSQKGLRKQFHQLAKRYHPDTLQGTEAKQRGSEKLKSINSAYRFLQKYLQNSQTS